METQAIEKNMVFDVEKIRQDFPILSQEIHKNPLIYFDNGATTQKPKQVIDAISDYYKTSNANVHRGLHELAERATIGYEGSRKKAAAFINAASERNIIFTRGTSESINLVAYSWGRKFLKPGDEVLLSEMEHHSNIVPWHILAEQLGIKVKFIPINKQGSLVLDSVDDLISDKTKLISITQMSNVLGTINPVKEIIQKAHSKNIKVLIDAAQSVPNMPVDVQDLDCDFLAFSAHKMLGPTGFGVLYAKEDIQNEMNPFLGGGEMIASVTQKGATWADIPHKFEAGTPNIAGAFGLSAAIDYLNDIGMDNIQTYKKRLTRYAIDAMQRVPGLEIFGQAEERGSVVAFNIKGVHPFDLAQFLDQNGIAIRSGHHCAQPLMESLNVSSTARASFYIYNTFQEIDVFVEKLEKSIQFF
jgi:cysteine desulfurase/selenocysteine lyase